MRDRFFTRLTTEDGGFALVAVVGAMMVLTAFALTALTFAVSSLRPSRTDQDSKAAVAAAQAGIDEYLSRLDASDNYWTNNNIDPNNKAFTTGSPVPGTAGRATFTYRAISTPAVNGRGIVRLRSTGASRGVTRSLTAQVQHIGFLKYIYYTDVEALDPALYVTDTYVRVNGSSGYTDYNFFSQTYGHAFRYVAKATQLGTACSQYYYAGRSSGSYTSSVAMPYYLYDSTAGTYPSGNPYTNSTTVSGFVCTAIQFPGGDVISGPLHSNDALQIVGPALFTNPVTETSWPDVSTPAPTANHRWWGNGTPSSAGYRPVYGPPVNLPDTNSDLVKYADPTPPNNGPGCTYSGATKITFSGTQMTVLSPNTTNAQTPSRCLDVSNRANPQTKAIPPMIYVTGATSCTSGSSTDSGVGYPVAGESTTVGKTTNYDCRKGTAYVSGTVSGQVTIGTADDIVITGNLTYQNGTGNNSTDAIGLIPNHYVWVYHPVDSYGNNLLSSSNSVHVIDAGILCVQDSFLVQNWAEGAALSDGSTASSLTVNGSISQKFRGPVGTGNENSIASGYLKNYLYDGRLYYSPPPYFLAPKSAPWTVTQTTDG